MERKIVCKSLRDAQVEALVCAEPSAEREELFAAAGRERMTDACAKHPDCAPGDAYWTPGFDLPARLVLHARMPESAGEAEVRALWKCVLQRLAEKGVRSAAVSLLGREQLGSQTACRLVREATEVIEKPDKLYLCTADRAEFRLLKG